MANPKTLPEKLAQFQNDSFSVWLQKTNISATEVGDLNNLFLELLNVLKSTLTKAGTVSASLGGITLTGTGTSFSADYAIGDTIKVTAIVNSITKTYERKVVAINTSTITVDAPFAEAFSSATHENLKDLSLVSAINYIYGEYSRINLIKAIAMS